MKYESLNIILNEKKLKKNIKKEISLNELFAHTFSSSSLNLSNRWR